MSVPSRYQPAVSYTDTIESVCRSAEAMVRTGIALPSYLGPECFDYEREDVFLDTVKSTRGATPFNGT